LVHSVTVYKSNGGYSQIMSKFQDQALFGRFTVVALLAALAVVPGCDSDSGTGIGNNLTSGGITAPSRIRESLVVDQTQVKAILTINGQQFEMPRFGDDQFRIQIPNLPANTDFTLEVLFTETLQDGTDLRLARIQQITRSSGSADLTVNLSEDQFLYDFDDDQDEISNILEREQNTDPFFPETEVTSRNVFVQYNIPQRITDPTAILDTTLILDINRERNRDNRLITVLTRAPSNVEVTIEARLEQFFEGSRIIVAQATEDRAAGTADLLVVLTDQLFDFDIDNDDDGVSNFDELQAGTNPFDVNSN